MVFKHHLFQLDVIEHFVKWYAACIYEEVYRIMYGCRINTYKPKQKNWNPKLSVIISLEIILTLILELVLD